MQLALGIDTGGTYTDAVLVNHETGDVLAGAKALTTRHDLSVGIGGAIQAVFAAAADQGTPFAADDIAFVALSTTLATNALAEGHSAAVCLLLIGYDPDLIREVRLPARSGDGGRGLPGRRSHRARRRGRGAGRGGRPHSDPGPPRHGGGIRDLRLLFRAQPHARAAGARHRRGVDRPTRHLRPRADQPAQRGAAGHHGGPECPPDPAVARADGLRATDADRARHRCAADGRAGRRLPGARRVGDAPAHRDDPFWAGGERSGRLAPGRAQRLAAGPAGCLDGGCRRHNHRHRGLRAMAGRSSTARGPAWAAGGP